MAFVYDEHPIMTYLYIHASLLKVLIQLYHRFGMIDILHLRLRILLVLEVFGILLYLFLFGFIGL